MRLQRLSIFWQRQFKPFCHTLKPRYLSQDNTQPKIAASDPSYLEVCPSWPAEEEPELRASVLRDMRIIPNFITEQEEAALMAELEPVLKRMRYEFDHWDNAIEGYRETERSRWAAESAGVVSRARAAAFSGPDAAAEPLPRAHVLDLSAAGYIRPHIDAVRFCGGVIAGICLLSSAVMRLEHPDKKHLAVDALLERRCLYIMRGAARYSMSHAVRGGGAGGGAGGGGEQWRGAPVPRRRRVAVILRQKPLPQHTQ